jgi:ribosome-binding protein aMBF1 (putative translation factor)
MDIREFLFSNRMSVKELAEKLDVHPNHITAIKNGRYKAGKKLARDIETLSGGGIKAEELRKPIAEKKSA